MTGVQTCALPISMGLRLLLDGVRVDATDPGPEQQAIRAHLRPEPRVAFGHALGEAGLAHAMIDVSDGLAQDLAHLCEQSGVCAILDFECVPVADAVRRLAATEDDAFELAARGGEDYELLFTAPPEHEAALHALANEHDLPLARIGEIVAPGDGSLLRLRRAGDLKPVSIRGFDHFPTTPAV